MRDFEQEIRPGIGLGSLVLGASQQAVRALLGDPADEQDTDCGDGIGRRLWEYDVLGLSLAFDEDDDCRLGSITTSYEWATLGSDRIVGLSEEELLHHEFEGLGPPTLEDDFGEFGRDYVWDELNLSCWVVTVR